MRMPDPSPLGETFFRAIVLAICSAEPVKVPGGGAVESVLIPLTHPRVDCLFATEHTLSSTPLEELHRAFVLFCGCARF